MSGTSANNSTHNYYTTNNYVAPPMINTHNPLYDHRRQPSVPAQMYQNYLCNNNPHENYPSPLPPNPPCIVSTSTQQSGEFPSSFSSTKLNRHSTSLVDVAPLIQQLPQLDHIELCSTPPHNNTFATSPRQFNGAISASSSLTPSQSQSTFPGSTSTYPIGNLDGSRPHHGNNVHMDGLAGLATYAKYAGVQDGACRYTHDPYAQRYTMRASCLPFEREATMVSDMQTVLNTICPQTVVVVIESARKASKGHDVELVLRTTSDPRRLAFVLNEAVVLMDRHGFHYIVDEGHSTSTIVTSLLPFQFHQSSRKNSPPCTRREQLKKCVADYCQHIRRLPQHDYRWYLDGLPSSIVRFQLELAR